MKHAFIMSAAVMLALQGVAAATGGEYRALWVTRWNYESAQDIAAIMRNAARYNFNTILFQVRGNGTVLYESDIEPWAEDIGGTHPGWDPLKTAIEEAHRHGIQLHAWVNVYTGWSGMNPPRSPRQLYHAHPDWFVTDPKGVRQKLGSGYLWLAPTHPEVQSYLTKVVRELVVKYDFDGLHLDYIRFPGPGFSYDPASIAHFRTVHGVNPEEDPRAWDNWRRASVTRLLGIIYATVKAERPQAIVSSAVVGDQGNGYSVFFQDSHQWLAKGIVDVLFPMMYTTDTMLFTRLTREYVDESRGRHVCAGIHIRDGYEWARQLHEARALGCQGFALFSYQLLFEDHIPEAMTSRIFAALLAEKADIPEMAWKAAQGDVQGPIVSDFVTIPPHLREAQPFRVLCRITDPGGVYDDDTGSEGEGVHLVWSLAEEGAETGEVRMAAVEDREGWYVTTDRIPAQEGGSEIMLRVFARDNADKRKRNLGYSDIVSLVIDFADDTYHYQGEIGPYLWNATSIAADSSGQLWITASDDNCVHVLDDEGVSAYFSPLKIGLAADSTSSYLLTPGAVAVNQQGIVHIGADNIIYRYEASTGAPLPGIAIPFAAGDIDFDRDDAAYVLERGSTLWHVFTSDWRELEGSPFGQKLAGNGIAVAPDGKAVYIASESEGKVQQWLGTVQAGRARFWQEGFLRLSRIGGGRVSTDGGGSIYAAQMPVGRVTVLDPLGNITAFLNGGAVQRLRAPRGVSICPTGSVIYVLETGAEGPIRIKKWRRR